MKPWQMLRKAYKEKDTQESVFLFVEAVVFRTPDADLRGKYQKVSDWWLQSYDFCKSLGLYESFSYKYLLLPSKEGGYVTYYQSLSKMLKETSDGEGIRTKTTIGRFLNKFTDMDQQKIKSISDKFSAKYGNKELFLIPNTDPDGWEAVYESATGFTSCMQYSRPNLRHLDEKCYGEFHPARAYAHPDNDLALAYMANREWDKNLEGFKVYARSIVNVKNKTFLRVYGDDSLVRILESKGYTHSSSTTDNQKLRRIEINNGTIVCPYLDGEMHNVKDMGDYLLTSYDGYVTSSRGVISTGFICPNCGRVHDQSSEARVYVAEYDDERCIDCVHDSYQWGYVYKNQKGWIHNDEAECIDGVWYTSEAAEWHDYYFSYEEEDWVHEDYSVWTSRGIMSVSNNSVVKLDIEDPDGHEYAHVDDTSNAWDENGKKYIVHEDTNLEEHNLFDYNPTEEEKNEQTY